MMLSKDISLELQMSIFQTERSLLTSQTVTDKTVPEFQGCSMLETHSFVQSFIRKLLIVQKVFIVIQSGNTGSQGESPSL